MERKKGTINKTMAAEAVLFTATFEWNWDPNSKVRPVEPDKTTNPHSLFPLTVRVLVHKAGNDIRVIINGNKDRKMRNLIDEDEDDMSVLEVKTTVRSIPLMSAYPFRIKTVIGAIFRKGLRLEVLEAALTVVSAAAENKTAIACIHIMLGKSPFNVA